MVFAALGVVVIGCIALSAVLSHRRSQPPGNDAEARRSTSTNPTSTNSTTTAPITAPPTITTTTPTGRFVGAPGSGPVHGSGRLYTYSTEVEEGSGVDPSEFAEIVDGILSDPRGWTVDDGVSFQRVASGGAITISLATPATTDQICLPLQTNGKFSCREGSRAVLNLRRWNEGTTDLPLSVDDYRAEVVNHEVGHTLGKGHVGCGGPGLRAPVMMQQSKGLGGCLANPWPTLDGT
jgi:hypothetical protein